PGRQMALRPSWPLRTDKNRLDHLRSIFQASQPITLGHKPRLVHDQRYLLCILSFKVPTFVRMLAPEGALNIHEKAWNAYPYCRTGECEDFLIKIETWHKPDLGTQENVHKLDPEAWKHVEAIYIDIADRSQVLSKDYKSEEDPAKFKSIKTGRGPLGPNWKQELLNQKDCPYMCAYKLVTVKFKWWGLQNKVENFIHKQEKRLFTNFHRQLFCWLDKWVDLTMDDIRRMEEETKRQLDEDDTLPGQTHREVLS
uniref:Phosphatidylinositol transfer protein alpha isoform n=1 Tax=Prolemur simus TaxID=1328070 RepID=A0A8C8ZRD5_PROSS